MVRREIYSGPPNSVLEDKNFACFEERVLSKLEASLMQCSRTNLGLRAHILRLETYAVMHHEESRLKDFVPRVEGTTLSCSP